LFNDERYHRCNLRPGQRLFRYDHAVGNSLIGTLSGVVEDELLDCGHSAPFGGIDCVRRRETAGVVLDLLRAASTRARAEGIREIRIRARPGYFGPNEFAAQFALLNLGASIESCELALGLELGRFEAPEEYLATLRPAERSAVRHGLRTGLVFAPAETAEDWAACYELLAETKRRRGAQPSISFGYLLKLSKIFGKRIAMHRLMQGCELAGAALVYRVRRDWDYVAAWGDDLQHRQNRVMNVMAYQLVRAAIVQRVTVIDIGTSSVRGVPDDGLVQFKRNIGGATGLRLNFRLSLA
jgi:Acetyltransferase (GNAT) domain